MTNLFDSANYPTNEPDRLVIGDRWTWKRTDLGNDYDNSLFTLSYDLRLEGAGSTTISISASASGTDYIVEVGQATTAGYTSGVYRWDAYITRNSDSERVRVDYGVFDIRPDKANSTADPRSDNKIIYDAIVATIKGRASLDQQKYEIGNRALWRTPLPDLMALEQKYKKRVDNEIKKERIRNGKGSGNLVKIRF